MKRDIWPLVHAERAALIGDLADLAPEQWEQASLCEGWTVHDVVAHLVDTYRTTRVGFFTRMLRARFDFDRQNAYGVKAERGGTPDETLDRLRRAAPLTSTPPGPLGTRLVEEVVHGEDIRRPLGIAREYPQAAVVAALRTHTALAASMGGAKELVAPVKLRALDADVQIGDGPEVRGTALALLLAVNGRRAALDELEGPGAAALAKA
ncbi:maleylpyruvate isomerase family mycothiol-dependent enzyme [Glycomyces algeriensis]|uniref:Mycothiol-dependent maleylpyruvate isomerase metal-binding domain-containing protein n=1 Tax=Glycomyces algeriensis TaxID=256037 RepID=A0A9W6G7N8_9ACTN|nr:maleylpyruvate isomerase family mycothiol-dependent enzyme [Glycomyces algeriensis]MDR7350013.1 uncharacterized protein (TIGR03083 family) [Glycomyces algeriensis]GLI42724.1 hypothetical protein GALLR39Z86_25740 [Glycomyces algeriensis]